MARSSTWLIGTTALVVASLSACSNADGADHASYPTQDIRMIVPFAAGGATDAVARVPGACVAESLGVNLIVENKPGGGGAVGAADLAREEPDGYTLGTLAPATVAIAPHRSEGAQYSEDDFDYIGTAYEIPAGIMVAGDSPYQTAEDLLAAAKAEPGSVSIATPGANTPFHLEMEKLKSQHDVPIQIVPFDGGAPAETAMLGGSVDALVDGVTAPKRSLLEAGDIRVLATGSADPVHFLPEVPSLADLGYSDLTSTDSAIAWGVPAGAPAEVIDVLTGALETCLATPEVQQTLGGDYIPETFQGPDATAQRMEEYVNAFAP